MVIRFVALLLLAAALPAALAAAQQPRRYSGKVEQVDLVDGMMVVGELGEKGRALRHQVYVAPDTPIVSAGRLRPAEMRGSNTYGEVPVSLVDLVSGDFVVVESVEEGGRALAVRITVVEPARRTP